MLDFIAATCHNIFMEVTEFVKRQGSQFTILNQKFRFAGINNYPLVIDNISQSSIDALFSDCQKLGITVVRTWAFDTQGFRTVDYPLGTNLLTNGGFESNITSWVTYLTDGSDTVAWDSSDSSSRTGCIKVVSGLGVYTGFNQTITVVANTDYILTFWYKLTMAANQGSTAGQVPAVSVHNGSNFVLTQKGLSDTGGLWVKKQYQFNSGIYTSVAVDFEDNNGVWTGYFDDVSTSVKSLGTLIQIESQYKQLDLVLTEAKKYGIRLILSFMDGNEFNYNSKSTYVQWANSVYGDSFSNTSPYYDFFTSSDCQTIYKGFIDSIVSRINTYSGIAYKNDPTIFSYELGNELRANTYGSNDNTLSSSILAAVSGVGGWADIMSTYIKSKDPNHMVGFGDTGHEYTYLQDGGGTGDVVYNGTYYGVSHKVITALPNIDYGDPHIYPDQDDNVHLHAAGGKYWGQAYGYTSGVSGDGLRAQLKGYIDDAHANNKPCILGEVGYISSTTGDNTYYPLYNRFNAFKAIFTDFLDNPGGDGLLIWHCIASASNNGTYDIALEATGGAGVTDNSNDTDIVNLIDTYNISYAIIYPVTNIPSTNPPSSPFIPTIRDYFIPSFINVLEGAQITITVSPSQAFITDQQYTYNQVGLTYNQAGVQYGGLNAGGEDIVPELMTFMEAPHLSATYDTYTIQPVPPPPGSHQSLGPGFFMFVTT